MQNKHHHGFVRGAVSLSNIAGTIVCVQENEEQKTASVICAGLAGNNFLLQWYAKYQVPFNIKREGGGYRLRLQPFPAR